MIYRHTNDNKIFIKIIKDIFYYGDNYTDINMLNYIFEKLKNGIFNYFYILKIIK